MAKTKSDTKNPFLSRLKAAGKNWGAAKEKAAAAKANAPTEFDDGRYMARLVSAELGESQNGRLQVVFKFKFEEDDHHQYGGQQKYDYQGIESEQNLEFFGRRLDQLGYELPEDLESIVDILADITKDKPLCKIRLKSKGDFQNVYIDKVYGAEDTEDEDAEAEDADEVEEAPAPKKGKSKKAEPVEEEEEESDDEEEESDEEEEEEEEVASEEEEDGDNLTVGMTVIAETSKGERTGTVLEILEAEGLVRMKTEDGKVLRIALDKLSLPADVPEEPAPKSKKSKK